MDLSELTQEQLDEMTERLDAIKGINVDSLQKDSQALSKIITDPDVLALLEAKEKGVSVAVMRHEPITKEPEDVDLNTLDNQGLVKHLMGQMPGLLKSALTEAIDPIRAEIGSIKSVTTSTLQEREAAMATALSRKYPDVGKYKDAIEGIRKENPKASLEEAYIMARLRSGAGLPQTGLVETERPTGVDVRVNRKDDGTDPKKGRVGWTEMLTDAVERLDVSGQG